MILGIPPIHCQDYLFGRRQGFALSASRGAQMGEP